MTYTQEEFTKRLKTLHPETKEVVLNIETNPAIYDFAETYGLDQETTYAICHQITLQILDFNNKNQVIDYISNLISVEKNEIEEMYPILYSNIFSKNPDLIQHLSSVKQPTEEKPIEKTERNDSISHTDILDEIENPTPSLKTTASFANKPANAPVKAVTQTSSTTTAVTTATPANQPTKIKTSIEAIQPSAHLGGFADNATGNMHPAEKVAAKLGQNLTAPSASIPKEVYIPKRPDPYHEPIE